MRYYERYSSNVKAKIDFIHRVNIPNILVQNLCHITLLTFLLISFMRARLAASFSFGSQQRLYLRLLPQGQFLLRGCFISVYRYVFLVQSL